MGDSLAKVFLEKIPAHRRKDHDAPGLESTLAERLAAARAAWPGVSLAPRAFAAHLGAILARAEEEQRTVEDLNTDDLYVACACARGDAAAVQACDERFAPEIRRALGRMGLADPAIDELRQALREKLFVADAQQGPCRPVDPATRPQAAGPGPCSASALAGPAPKEPYIAAYSGRGRLGGWMRVIAVHLALKSFRGQHRHRPFDEEELEQMVSAPELAGLSPEQEHMKVLYRAEFKEAFREAVGTLSDRDRALLRQHYLEGQNIDAIGEAFAVHRATAARWINKAREALIDAVRRTIVQHCRLDPESYESVVQLVRSQLDVSIRRLLE